MTYKWTDGEDNEKEMLVYSKYAILSGLAENKNYDVKVAGLTIKGIGVFSSKATMSTLEDGNCFYNQTYHPPMCAKFVGSFIFRDCFVFDSSFSCPFFLYLFIQMFVLSFCPINRSFIRLLVYLFAFSFVCSYLRSYLLLRL